MTPTDQISTSGARRLPAKGAIHLDRHFTPDQMSHPNWPVCYMQKYSPRLTEIWIKFATIVNIRAFMFTFTYVCYFNF